MTSKSMGTMPAGALPRSITTGSFIGVGSYGTGVAKLFRGKHGSFSGTFQAARFLGRLVSKVTAITVDLTGPLQQPPNRGRMRFITGRTQMSTAGASVSDVSVSQQRIGTICWEHATSLGPTYDGHAFIPIFPTPQGGSYRFNREAGKGTFNLVLQYDQ